MAEKKLLQLLDSISIDKNTNLLPTTLKDGVTCLGVEGDVAPLSITEDATAVANDLAIGKTAYINNEKVEGTLFESTDEVVELGLTSDISIGNVASDGVNTVEVKKLIKNDMILRTGQDAGISIVGSDLAETLEVTSEKLLEGNTILGIEGTAKSLDITNDATATASDISMGKTAYINGNKITGKLYEFTEALEVGQHCEAEEGGMDNIRITSKINAGGMSDCICRFDNDFEFYAYIDNLNLSSAIGLTSDKIVSGNTILGVVGTGTTGVDTSDATATAEFIANGKTAYVNDEKVTGTADHYVTSDDTIILASAAVTENVMGLDCVTYTTPIQNGLCSTPTMFISGEKDFRLALPVDRIASAIELTPEKILEGNTILGVVGTAKQEEGTKVYGTLEELQAVTGTEGQFAIVNSGETFDGAYKYTNGAWVEMFSSRRYDGTLTPEDYTTATETASNILGE